MQHNGSSGAAAGGATNPSALDMQRLQQQLQAQYNWNNQQQQGNAAMNHQQQQQYASPVMNPTAYAMMQQQQQYPSNNNTAAASTATNSNMLHSTMWGAQQQQPMGLVVDASSLDASTGSSARLMAMATMNHPLQQRNSHSLTGGGQASMQNMQAILQQQQMSNQATLTGNFQQAQQQILQQQQGKQNAMFPSPQQQTNMLGAAASAGMNVQQQQPLSPLDQQQQGRTAVTASQQILFQQQFANLQKQIQQGGTTAVAANAAVAALRNAAANLQMQQPVAGANNNTLTASNSNSLMRQQLQQQQFYMQSQQQQVTDPTVLQRAQQPFPGGATSGHGSLGMRSISSETSLTSAQPQQQQQQQSQQQQQQAQPATLTEQHLRLHQQQQQALMQRQQSQQQPSGAANNHAQQPEIPSWQQHYGNMNVQQQPQGSGVLQQDSASVANQPSGSIATIVADNTSTTAQRQQVAPATGGADNASLRSYLNGNFVGGWQSNSDLPDRRRVIFQILDVIRMMRPENTKMNDKLPHMAKSLEEHLYRSAPSKEEYLNTATLKSRLQAIAQGLETHRSTSSTSISSQQQGKNYAQQGAANTFGQHQQSLEGNAAYTNNETQNASWAQQQQPSYNSTQLQQPQYDALGAPMNNVGQNFQHPTQQHVATNMMHSAGTTGTHVPVMQQHDVTWGNVQQAQQLDAGNNGVAAPQFNQFQLQQQDNYATQQPAQQVSGGMNAAMNTLGGASNVVMGQQEQQQAWALANDPSQTVGGFSGQADPLHMDSSRFQDTDAVQKKRVIAQQQQRLLLLRHASKCMAGPACTTRFCPQMVTLWRHMKTCRDKKCRTPHCLSSRCVLNHYRICKSQGKTATCEVCGPVMAKIKQLEREDGSVDPLVGQHDSQPPSAAPMQQMQPAMNAQPQQQVFDMSSQLQQQQQLQAQLKLRIEQLQQLQKQQQQLQEQQKRLQEQEQRIDDPNSQQAYQLHQQQTLLGELQKRCQQQQNLLQNELQQQAGNIMPAVTQPLQQHMLQTSSRLTQNLHQGAAQQLQAGLTMAAQQLQAQAAAAQVQVEAPPQQLPLQFSQPQAQHASHDNHPLVAGVGEGQLLNPQYQGSSIMRGKAARRGSGIGKGFANIAAGRNEMPKAQKKRIVTAGTAGGKERSQKKAKAAAARALAPLSKDLDVSEQSVPPYLLPSTSLGTSLITALTRENITRHLESLNKKIRLSPRTVSHKCLPIIQEIIDDQFGWVFADPVDPVALGLPDYFDVVKNPMHLDLVRKKLDSAIYADLESFARDTKLVFENAILYNGEESEVGALARSLLTKFEQLYSALVQGIESSQQTLESKGEACSLCGTQKRMFEPTILYCRGKCGMQRIKRQDSYVTDRTKQNHWCMGCYELLQPDDPIILDDGTETYKKDLQEFKNDALPEEGWVNCDECNSWCHQVCGLFNGRTNKSNASYTCPNCYLKKVDAGLIDPPLTTVKGASDLPQSTLSQAIEKGLIGALQVAYQSRAKDLAVGIEEVEKAEGLSVRVLANVEKKHFVGNEMARLYELKGCKTSFPFKSKCIALFQTLDGVDTLLFAMYVYEYGHDCPAPNRRRVYISYLDSVQYFEPRCYRTVVYQSILVEYLRHVKRRGFHTAHIWSCPPTPGDDYIFYCHPEHQKFPREDMLRAWYDNILTKAKTEGIVIQTTSLFDEYFANDVVRGPSKRADPTCLPYFEGDYIPGELEIILRGIKSQGQATTPEALESEVMRRLGHNVLKMKENFIVAHLRSRRFAAAVEEGEDVSNWPEDSDDEVVRSKRAKISGKGPDKPSSTSEKAPFETASGLTVSAVASVSAVMPVDGTPEGSSTSESVVLCVDDVEGRQRERVGSSDDIRLDVVAAQTESVAESSPSDNLTEIEETKQTEHANEVLSCDTAGNKDKEAQQLVDDQHIIPAANQSTREPCTNVLPAAFAIAHPGPEERKLDNSLTNVSDSSVQVDFEQNSSRFAKDIGLGGSADNSTNVTAIPVLPEVDATTSAPIMMLDESHEGRNKSSGDEIDAEAPQPMAASGLSNSLEVFADEETSSKMTLDDAETQSIKKRALNEIAPAIKSHFADQGIVHSGQPVGDTSDVDELIESEMFESRQLFLNYCQTNHCQFDEQRRAKHSSMMVLFQLHNPTAPKFLQQCSACYVDITHGFRYHCNKCPDFDLCQNCYAPVTSGEWAKRDARFAHDPSHTFTPINTEEEITQEATGTREERSKALKTHIALLEHAGHCQGAPACALQNCVRMKSLFEHIQSCSIKPKKDCRTCNRLLSLFAMHSRLCGVRGHCPIPFCDRIRERYARLRQQQQLMDDRRRQAQNELYHAAES
ncbi:hypothetical protein MPSEU_000233100 [Mayamaea pseudoterrestris]|nr:hypothetical protein MPSEU_000233100 [Mayamaea pseudoterrestris]